MFRTFQFFHPENPLILANPASDYSSVFVELPKYTGRRGKKEQALARWVKFLRAYLRWGVGFQVVLVVSRLL